MAADPMLKEVKRISSALERIAGVLEAANAVDPMMLLADVLAEEGNSPQEAVPLVQEEKELSPRDFVARMG